MIIVGIDEVGRGCWAGPVMAGAVILNDRIEGLKDSKKLSAKQRRHLSNIIKKHAEAWSVGAASPEEIDELGINGALSLAMSRALTKINKTYDEIIIDGNVNYLPDFHGVKTIVKADVLVPAVSAASIIAKVARDEFMAVKAKQFPEYGFDNHVGYGTAEHKMALDQYGPCWLHRRSFKPIANLL